MKESLMATPGMNMKDDTAHQHQHQDQRWPRTDTLDGAASCSIADDSCHANVLDCVNAIIFGTDVDGKVNEWNKKTAEVTCYTKNEALSKPLVPTFIPSVLLQDRLQCILDKSLKGGDTSDYVLRICTKRGETRVLLASASPRRDEVSRAITGVLLVAQDVTDAAERNKAEYSKELLQEMRVTKEAKVMETERNMTAYFAHELRNPLHAIESALELMPTDIPEEARSLVHSMKEGTNFMMSIMNNLLDIRKMEEGKMTLNREPLSLSLMLKRVHNMLAALVQPGVKMTCVCETGDKEWVLGDPHRVLQVYTNVVSNAIKYTSSGSIVLSMKWEGDMLRFGCADTGLGIPKEHQSKLFERFMKVGGAPGTGLGLAIAKQVVDLKGGRIGFESDPDTKPGTTFFVDLPLHPCDKPVESCVRTAPTLSHPSGPGITDPITFLLVDDIAINRSLFRRRVTRNIAPNATFTEASTGEQALEICRLQFFDVVVVDQHMENAGGVLLGTETVAAMRRQNVNSIIIGCSGNDIDKEFMDAGSSWVMGKPSPPDSVIRKKLQGLLFRRRNASIDTNAKLGSSQSLASRASDCSWGDLTSRSTKNQATFRRKLRNVSDDDGAKCNPAANSRWPDSNIERNNSMPDSLKRRASSSVAAAAASASDVLGLLMKKQNMN
jgi:PAS domain S-box-containing protein